MTQAYPLAWPPGWPRTAPPQRQAGGQFRVTLNAAVNHVSHEVQLIGGQALVVSSNFTLSNQAPTDPGIAVYFTRKGRPVCIPCDRWQKIEANLRAISLTLEALRGIDRWGAKHTLDAVFQGFAALPPPPTTDRLAKPWWVVLDVPETATLDQVERAYRDKAKAAHPDAGGAGDHMVALNVAIVAARAALGGRP